MNEQPVNQPQPPADPQQINPVPTPAPQAPIVPGYMGQPSGPVADPRYYQSPNVPITSHASKLPIWLLVAIGVSFAAAVGLLIAVFVLM